MSVWTPAHKFPLAQWWHSGPAVHRHRKQAIPSTKWCVDPRWPLATHSLQHNSHDEKLTHVAGPHGNPRNGAYLIFKILWGFRCLFCYLVFSQEVPTQYQRTDSVFLHSCIGLVNVLTDQGSSRCIHSCIHYQLPSSLEYYRQKL